VPDTAVNARVLDIQQHVLGPRRFPKSDCVDRSRNTFDCRCIDVSHCRESAWVKNCSGQSRSRNVTDVG